MVGEMCRPALSSVILRHFSISGKTESLKQFGILIRLRLIQAGYTTESRRITSLNDG